MSYVNIVKVMESDGDGDGDSVVSENWSTAETVTYEHGLSEGSDVTITFREGDSGDDDFELY